jgi:putative tryptophan/tyrosine transport system permease protein
MNGSDLLQALVDALETGLPYSMAFAGIWLMFRVLQQFDLTVDATFTTGAATAALCLTNGLSPWVALAAAAAAGAASGALTFMVHAVFRLPVILASIVVAVGLFSVNLRVMGTPNINLLDTDLITTWWTGLLGTSPRHQWSLIALFTVIVAAVLGVLAYFLTTHFGLALRASGINPLMARAQGFSPIVALFVGLVLANALVGTSGALVAQDQGFVDINMGIGTVIFGVTAILLGDIARRGHGPATGLAAVVLGTLAYRFILAVAFRLGVPPEDFQGMTALVVLLAIAISVIGRRAGRWRSRRHPGTSAAAAERPHRTKTQPTG